MQLPEKLYHISNDLNHNGAFTPKVPFFATIRENKTIPRICFSDSIENCLSAMPCGGPYLQGTLESSPIFKVYTLDVDKKDKELISNIVDPVTLFYNSYVVDALQSKEHWVTKEMQFTEENTFYIKVTNFKTRRLPLFFYDEIVLLSQDKGFKKLFPQVKAKDLIYIENLDDNTIKELLVYFAKNKLCSYNCVKIQDLEYEIYNSLDEIPNADTKMAIAI